MMRAACVALLLGAASALPVTPDLLEPAALVEAEAQAGTEYTMDTLTTVATVGYVGEKDTYTETKKSESVAETSYTEGGMEDGFEKRNKVTTVTKMTTLGEQDADVTPSMPATEPEAAPLEATLAPHPEQAAAAEEAKAVDVPPAMKPEVKPVEIYDQSVEAAWQSDHQGDPYRHMAYRYATPTGPADGAALADSAAVTPKARLLLDTVADDAAPVAHAASPDVAVEGDAVEASETAPVRGAGGLTGETSHTQDSPGPATEEDILAVPGFTHVHENFTVTEWAGDLDGVQAPAGFTLEDTPLPEKVVGTIPAPLGWAKPVIDPINHPYVESRTTTDGL